MVKIGTRKRYLFREYFQSDRIQGARQEYEKKSSMKHDSLGNLNYRDDIYSFIQQTYFEFLSCARYFQ